MLRYTERTKILIEKAVIENWPMFKLAGFLSKPKRTDNASITHLEVLKKDDSGDQNHINEK